MTMQISDIYYYKGEVYDLIALESTWPFEVEELGVKPVPSDSACLRGYHCEYSIEDGNVFVKNLRLSLLGDYPIINGVESEYEYSIEVDESIEIDFDDWKIQGVYCKENEGLIDCEINVDEDKINLNEIEDDSYEEDVIDWEWGSGFRIYKNINIPVNYSGGMIIGKDYMDEKYSYWIRRPYGYITVYEIIFLDGRIQKVINRKKDMRNVRVEAKKRGEKKLIEEYGLNRCIRDVFNLEYDINIVEN